MLRKLLPYVILSLLSNGLLAATEDPFGKKNYGSFLHFDATPNSLYFFDKIEKNDSFQLRKALRNHDIQFIVLSSPGGDVWEGLNMAGIIHDKQLTTYIPPNQNEYIGICASACSYMFLAGKNRIAEGKLGVHQFYSDKGSAKDNVDKVQQSAQFTVSEIIGFLNEFKTPPFVYERMFQQDEMYFFNSSELNLIQVNDTETTDAQIQGSNAFLTDLFEWLKNLENTDTNAVNEEPTDEETARQLSEFIKVIQQRLNDVGCNAGSVDGVMGPRTRRAIKLFAKTARIPASDEVHLTETFIDALKNASPQFCPKPKPKISPNTTILAGSWEGTARCSNNRRASVNAVIISTGKPYEYRFTLMSLGGTTKGYLSHNVKRGIVSGYGYNNGERQEGSTSFNLNGKTLSWNYGTCFYTMTRQ